MLQAGQLVDATAVGENPATMKEVTVLMCADGKSLDVTFDGSQVSFQRNGKLEILQTVESASGAKYANADYVLNTKGNDAFLEDAKGSVMLKDCKLTSKEAMKPLSGKIKGSVIHLERIALPPATVTVRLVRVSANQAPTPIMTQTIQTGGKQVPFAFELAYENLDAQASYALEAEISYDGQVRWRNPQLITVLSRDEAVNAVTIRVSLVRSAADSVPANPPAASALSGVLTGTVFYLQRIALDPKAGFRCSLRMSPEPMPKRRYWPNRLSRPKAKTCRLHSS